MSAARTIAAVATPAGRGGVGIVRVSGTQAPDVLRALVPDWSSQTPSHKLQLCKIRGADGAVIDESLVVHFRAPNSYTGDDVVEFQCHGGPIILRGVLDACLAAGAQIAGPGEFTQRAYLNGRLDLTQAEAVADLVNATSEAAHRLALEHLQGSLGDAIGDYLAAVTESMVLLESAIDFSHEEHVYQIERDEVLRRIEHVLAGLDALRARFDQGRRKREGVLVVVMGPTNAGKSSLFNALVGSERAIVTDVAGTTRDWLEEELNIGGVAVRLVDTAGLRETVDRVERLGIERSRSLGARADIVVFIVDRTQPLTDAERSELQTLLGQGRPLLVCVNKADRDTALDPADAELLADLGAHDTAFGAVPPRFGGFVDALSEQVVELTQSEGVLLSRARHLQAVVAAIEALQRTRDAVQAEMELELIALDLREALDALGTIIGKVSTDDILNRIFSEFCVGK